MREFHAEEGDVINQFRIVKLIGSGKFGKCFVVQREGIIGPEMVMKVLHNVASEQEAYQNELKVLKSMPRTYKFPSFVAEFGIGTDFNFIVMTHCGITLHAIRSKNANKRFSLENTLRIGHQLFDLVHLFHSLGWLHRDLHSGNVTFTADQFLKPKLGIIDFGLCVSKSGPPVAEVMCQRNKSLSVNLGLPFTETDDYVAVVFILMRCLDLDPFDHGTFPFDRPCLRVAQKAQFHSSPHTFLTDDYLWIWKLYNLVESQRHTGIDVTAAQRYIKTVLGNFDPSTTITTTIINGEVTIN